HIADKRPPGFFAAWLADPARLNRDHRMPVFSLSAEERTAVTLFLAEQKSAKSDPDFALRAGAKRGAEGKKLIDKFRCAACHRLPEAEPARGQPAPRLGAESDWRHSCLGPPDTAKSRPGYRLRDRDAQAVRAYYAGYRATAEGRP